MDWRGTAAITSTPQVSSCPRRETWAAGAASTEEAATSSSSCKKKKALTRTRCKLPPVEGRRGQVGQREGTVSVGKRRKTPLPSLVHSGCVASIVHGHQCVDQHVCKLTGAAGASWAAWSQHVWVWESWRECLVLVPCSPELDIHGIEWAHLSGCGRL